MGHRASFKDCEFPVKKLLANSGEEGNALFSDYEKQYLELKCSSTGEKAKKIHEVMGVLTNPNEVIILQYVCVLHHHVVHLKLA